MENDNRVLAYNLAKEIEPEALMNISGGGSQAWCKLTQGPSGSATSIDWVFDCQYE